MPHKDTESYRFRFPGMPRQAAQFFDIANAKSVRGTLQPRSVLDFISTYDQTGGVPQPGAVDAICQRMCGAGYLSQAGVKSGLANIDGSANLYMSSMRNGVDPVFASRRFDCAVYGFPCIYDVFKQSILPISHHSMQNGRTSIGTGFVIGPTDLLTAAHCLQDASELGLRDVTKNQLKNAQYLQSRNAAIDLGLIQFAEPVFANLPNVLSAEPRL